MRIVFPNPRITESFIDKAVEKIGGAPSEWKWEIRRGSECWLCFT